MSNQTCVFVKTVLMIIQNQYFTDKLIGANVPKHLMLYHIRLMKKKKKKKTTKKTQKKQQKKQKTKKKKKQKNINNNIELHHQVRVKIYIIFIVMKKEILERCIHVNYSHVAVTIEVNEVDHSSLTNNRLVK